MSNMFDNYPQDSEYIPNNRHKKFCKNEITIMAGETTTHTFEVPFNVDEQTQTFDIIYKLGFEDVLIKDKKECTTLYDEEINKTFITCLLHFGETRLFANTVLSAHVQIRFTMLDGTVSYSEIYPIKLMTALDVNVRPRPPVPPQVLGGLGYTED